MASSAATPSVSAALAVAPPPVAYSASPTSDEMAEWSVIQDVRLVDSGSVAVGSSGIHAWHFTTGIRVGG